MGGCERLKIQHAFSVRQWSSGWHYYVQIKRVNLYFAWSWTDSLPTYISDDVNDLLEGFVFLFDGGGFAVTFPFMGRLF
jgi:hypothetical protein